jgi:transposase
MSGRLQTEMAAELGIMPTMLRRWKRKLQESGAPSASRRRSRKYQP